MPSTGEGCPVRDGLRRWLPRSSKAPGGRQPLGQRRDDRGVLVEPATHSPLEQEEPELGGVPQRERRPARGPTPRPVGPGLLGICLCNPPNTVRFVLDAKWKHIGRGGSNPIHEIATSDLYQLYAYGKRYECRAVALIYPRSGNFTSPLTAQFFDGLKLLCLPFDVASPESAPEQRAL